MCGNNDTICKIETNLERFPREYTEYTHTNGSHSAIGFWDHARWGLFIYYVIAIHSIKLLGEGHHISSVLADNPCEPHDLHAEILEDELCACACVCVCVHTCKHNICTHTHTHTHTHTQTCSTGISRR
jgi:hypothetical protein